MDTTLPGLAQTSPPSSPVAGVGPAASAGASAATPGAKETAPQFGGLRGGKGRKDGLVPGSEAAIKADREKARKRKEDYRKAQRAAVEPDALPAAASSGVAGPAQAAPGAVAADPGVTGHPPLPWDATMLAPLFEQLIPTVEEMTVNQVAARAAKTGLPSAIVREVETSAKWSAPAKKALELSAPQVAARMLNKTGISAENQPEVVFFTAVSSILAGQVMLLKRLDKLAAEQKAADKPKPAPPAEPTKP